MADDSQQPLAQLPGAFLLGEVMCHHRERNRLLVLAVAQHEEVGPHGHCLPGTEMAKAELTLAVALGAHAAEELLPCIEIAGEHIVEDLAAAHLSRTFQPQERLPAAVHEEHYLIERAKDE